jgi:antitoxin component YwqK of YwqJK toxin-antitoxin module
MSIKMNIEVRKTYYKNGQLLREISYVNGVAHGLCKYYYKNGQLMYEKPYVNGVLHGLYKQWYNNGKDRSKLYLVFNVIEGEEIIYGY